MASYTSCFIGIPIPQEFQEEFTKLIIYIQNNFPFIQTVNPKTPHITIFYLDEQSQLNLDEISLITQSHKDKLKGIKLRIKGFDYFTKENPTVLFLAVDYPPILIDFNKQLSNQLNKFSAIDNNLPFHPHLTLARLKDKQAQDKFILYKEKIVSQHINIDWEFETKEIALYGVDSTKFPEGQHKLITISI